jgi:membrane-bound lytic murein transglycosylase D
LKIYTFTAVIEDYNLLKFKHIFYCYTFVALFFSNSRATYAQNTVFSDDPISIMLDSIENKKFLDQAFYKPAFVKNNKFKFAPDSVPKYDDFVYQTRLSKLDANSPFDIIYNPIVKSYIEMYAIKRRSTVSRLMALAQYYYPIFEEQLDKYNLPLELKHLAIIESALNPNARSWAGASGLWQFMYPTGKAYGLNIDSYVDERHDPIKSTVAACEYLRFLYKMFGDWQMVLAAYNGGPGTVNRAIRRSGGKKTYWEIRPFLPRETQGYVPAFIAANYIMNYASEHNIYPGIAKKQYFEVDTIIIKEPLTFMQVSNALSVSVEEIKWFNPIYRKDVIPSGGYALTLPKDKIGQFLSNEQAIYALIHQQEEEKRKTIASAENTEPKIEQVEHVVARGEYLSAIAKKYKVSVNDIKRWNYLGKKGVRPGKVLVIKKKVIDTNRVINNPGNTLTENKDTNQTSSEGTKSLMVKKYKYVKGKKVAYYVKANPLAAKKKVTTAKYAKKKPVKKSTKGGVKKSRKRK